MFNSHLGLQKMVRQLWCEKQSALGNTPSCLGKFQEYYSKIFPKRKLNSYLVIEVALFANSIQEETKKHHVIAQNCFNECD